MTKQDVSQVERGTSKCDPLPPDHFLVHVNRGPLPPMPTLEALYSKAGVSNLFSGQHEWQKDSSRQGIDDVTAEEVIMVMKQLIDEEAWDIGGRRRQSIINWGLNNGLVPADEKEIYAFGMNHETRDFQLQHRVIGFGSFTVEYGKRYSAVLDHHFENRRVLTGCVHNCIYNASDRFLFVRLPVAT